MLEAREMTVSTFVERRKDGWVVSAFVPAALAGVAAELIDALCRELSDGGSDAGAAELAGCLLGLLEGTKLQSSLDAREAARLVA